MEIKLIHALVRIMKRADLTELEVDDSNAGLRVHLKRGNVREGGSPLVNVMQSPAAAAPTMMQVPLASGAPSGAETSAGPAALPPGTIAFTSPMVGTFYRSSSPDSAAFVDVGTTVDEEKVLCIVEAMKVMNEIKAEVKGRIVEILVENAEPVEFGQPLFLIQKG